jgi:hypothetical protein
VSLTTFSPRSYRGPSAVPLLVLDQFSNAEKAILTTLQNQLNAYQTRNKEANDFYEGTHYVKMLGVSVPPSFANIGTVSGWPATVVDVLEERLDWLGWTSGADVGLGEVYEANNLAVESGMGHLDAFIFGKAFVTVGTGDEGEPNPLVTVHSPNGLTTIWDARARRVSAALAQPDEKSLSLYLPNQTIRAEYRGGSWRVVDRDQHLLNRVPVAELVNRPRASRPYGKSEITRTVRYLTDAAIRTLLGMEVNREFYNSPQRYALGVKPEDFQRSDGSTVSPWEAIMGKVWAMGRDEDGNVPEVGQFPAASPAPYLEQVKGLAQMVAAEAGIPNTYMGFQTENPPSADAIRAGEARLVKRAERRQAGFRSGWLEVARLSLLVRDGSVPDGIDMKWRDPATPTKAATADAGAKIVATLPWLAETRVGLELLGLDAAQIERALAEKPQVAQQPAPVLPVS